MSIELATPTFSNEQICAHRGASGSHPENTRGAFDAAANLGAGWIETDIQCLADGELAIFHDAYPFPHHEITVIFIFPVQSFFSFIPFMRSRGRMTYWLC